MKKDKVLLKKTALLKRTIPYIKKEKGFFFLTIFLCFVISILSATTPFVTKYIIDTLLPNEDYNMITYSLILYAVIILVLAAARYSFEYVNSLTGMRIEKRIREDAIEKINKLKVDYYSLEPDGKIVAKITSDSSGVKVFYTTMFKIFNAVLNILIVYIGVIILKPILGLLVLIIVPIILIWITVYRKVVHGFYVDLRETGSRITGKLNEEITGTLIIQDFNQEELMLDEYKTLCRRYVKNDRKANTVNIYFGWDLLLLIKRGCEIGLLMYLGYQSIKLDGGITIGLISAFVENLDKMINPINAIFNNLNELEDSIVGATRVYNFIDEENDTRIDLEADFPAVTSGEIEFKDVNFSYVKGKQVLNNINLKVEPGKKIGIVGHTGSGKSSLMNLLLAYNDADSGKIYVDGNDITLYNKGSYRQNLGIVLQTPALFFGTIRSNITLNRDYTDEEVLKVLDLVGASYLLNKTNLGLDMPISFSGENLSLGEKQLISFARILLRNPKILVLDEATANIDSETEVKIKKATDIVSKGRTTFIIAHRLSTIKDADEIIVVDAGDIIARGNHDSLYQTCGVYKDMYDSQFKNSKQNNI